MKSLIKYWSEILGLIKWDIQTECINDSQVVYPNDCVGEERYYIGVSQDRENKTAIIHHMRDLIEEDILHELLHLANPGKEDKEGEDWINSTTDELLKIKIINRENIINKFIDI